MKNNNSTRQTETNKQRGKLTARNKNRHIHINKTTNNYETHKIKSTIIRKQQPNSNTKQNNITTTQTIHYNNTHTANAKGGGTGNEATMQH